MSELPDFQVHGYEAVSILGENPHGGRITYKVRKIATKKFMVIKQFRFATQKSNWSGMKKIEKEIQALGNLRNLKIPRFLESFDHENGLCLVQTYIEGQPLSKPQTFTPEKIKRIALDLLNILVEIQTSIPPIFHRDIKPDNILIDEKSNVYLIDFGLARIGQGASLNYSTTVAGTPGFMAPEQLLNKGITEATDLYGLGATLICLVCGIQPINLPELVDASFRINFREVTPQLSERFIRWLERMTEPILDKRFPNAKEALEALIPLDIIRVPDVQVLTKGISCEAKTLGEKITREIKVINRDKETQLEGEWQFLQLDSESWLQIHPKRFKGNNQAFKVTIDTSKIQANKKIIRHVELTTNGIPEKLPVELNIKSAPIPLDRRLFPIFPMLSLAFVANFASLAQGAGIFIGALWIIFNSWLFVSECIQLTKAFLYPPIFILIFWISGHFNVPGYSIFSFFITDLILSCLQHYNFNLFKSFFDSKWDQETFEERQIPYILIDYLKHNGFTIFQSVLYIFLAIGSGATLSGVLIHGPSNIVALSLFIITFIAFSFFIIYPPYIQWKRLQKYKEYESILISK